MVKQAGAERVRIRSDSRLIVGQVTGTFEAWEERMARYKDLALELLPSFAAFEIAQVPREENLDADILSKVNQTVPSYLTHMAKVQEIGFASIDSIQVNVVDNPQDEWMADLHKFLISGETPAEDDQSRKVRLRDPRFEVKERKLYKRSYGGPLLKCVDS